MNNVKDIKRAHGIIKIIGIGRPVFYTCPVKKLFLTYSSTYSCYDNFT